MPLSVPLLLFLIAALAIAAVFVVVARSTSDPATLDYARANRVRGVFFLSLSVILAIFLVLTLPRLPYPVEAASPAQVVNVVGKQYAFSLTDGPGPQSLDDWEAEFSSVAEVVQGSLVEFRVRTLDVNHGFAIYTPDGEILTQTQAMPGYVNRLRVRFDRAGIYRVLCLEFCGMSHHAMNGAIEVTEAGQ
jgi:cytochrome c oxidase subunit 2